MAAGLAPLWYRLSLAQPSDRSIPWVVAGDVASEGAVIAAGGLGSGHLKVSWSTRPDLKRAKLVHGSQAGAPTDNTAQAELKNLPSGKTIYYRASVGRNSLTGRFRTPPESPRASVRLLWGGDVVGQGWGIDPTRGGMLTFESMRREKPDLFLHCGDSIYADNPVERRKALDDGSHWQNLVLPEKSKVAKTLADFHGNFRYNFLDDHYRRFFREVPVIAQWDDHEILNNWNPRDHAALSRAGFRAFQNYWPSRGTSQKRFYRRVRYGPNVEVFVLDLRSHRAPNSKNRQTRPGPRTALLGTEQLKWLKKSLEQSTATWKIVAGEMPLATFAPEFGIDSWANGDGPVLGREFELANLLSHLKDKHVHNVVWLSADVHYAMAVKFQPDRANFQNFNPFWEFIAGPLHAGTFAPRYDLDSTFGAQEIFCAVPRDLKPNRPPSDNLQFYGKVDITSDSLVVSLHQRQGKEVYKVAIQAK